jgi:hypothetical protein
MDTNTSSPASTWKPTTDAWGLAAYSETKARFDALVMKSDQPRLLAYALWALSHDASLAGRELFSFRNGCGNDRPSPDHIQAAHSALKLANDSEPKAPRPATAKSKRKKPSTRRGGRQLSKMETAILANFSDASELITSYELAKKAIAKARTELAKAAEELRGVDREKARLLSELDPHAATVLKELGILG